MKNWCLKHVLVGLLLFGSAFACARAASANPQAGLAPSPADLSRATPRSSVRQFLRATSEADFLRAARLLDLRWIPPGRQSEVGPDLARKLRAVLDQKLPLEPDELSDSPEGNLDDGASTETLGHINLGDEELPIELRRVALGQGVAGWVFSRKTVHSIEPLYDAYGPGVIGERLPEWYHRRGVLDIAIWQWLAMFLGALLAGLGGFIGATVIRWLARRIAKRTKTSLDDFFVARLRGPLSVLLALWMISGALDLVRLPLAARDFVATMLGALFILGVAWGASRVVHALSDFVLDRMVISGAAPDEELVRLGQEKRVETGRRFINALILFLGFSLALTQFDVVRKVGVSLLASAGVIGVVLGFAAQKSVANLIAGLQICVAQPIRIGDRVQVSGDVGWIEDITLTYVTMKTWDLRRRVFPITYFIENEFENWTMNSSQHVGQIVLHADYGAPVELIRERILELIEQDPDWDGDVAKVIVLDTKPDSVVLRVTASSREAGVNWDLRSRVREGAVALLQQLEGGRYLPRHRLETVEQ